jgi:hypothetical protein
MLVLLLFASSILSRAVRSRAKQLTYMLFAFSEIKTDREKLKLTKTAWVVGSIFVLSQRAIS